MTEVLEPQTPPQGTPVTEPTEQTTPSVPDEEKEQMQKKLTELEAQKEHWRTKYERDITNALPNEPAPPSEEFSDEGKVILEKHVAPLQNQINVLEDQLAIKDLQAQYPPLKELSTEFNEFRKEYPRHKMENVAKLFLVEKGLVEAPRKGLEKTTGGTRTAPTSGMTAEDIKNLRETNFKKYSEMLMKGQIKIE